MQFIFFVVDHKKQDGKNPRLLDELLLQLVNVKIYFYISSLLIGNFILNCETIFELATAGCFTVSIDSIVCLC